MTTFERMMRDLRRLDRNGSIPTPDTLTPIVIDEKAKLTFAVWGDPQIASWSPLRSARMLSALRDLDNMEAPLDALILAGDITENGKLAEFQVTAKLLREHHSGYRSLICVSGNHDVRLREYTMQLGRFRRFLAAVPGGDPGDAEHYYTRTEIGGYTFLLMGTDRASFEGAYISEAQLQWLEQNLAEAAEIDKPVFVVNHQTLPRVNGLPITWLGKGDWRGTIGWESKKVRALFEQYGRGKLIFITGHLHYGVSEYTYEDCGEFKALSVPTVGVVNHGEFNKDSQGYVVAVYDDRIIARARLFGEGYYVPDTTPGAYVEIKLP